jgi:hypothetical protein
MAVLLIPLFMLLIGIWEMGRLIQVKQVLQAGAREGARQASQGMIVKTTGAFVTIYTTAPDPPPTGVLPAYLDDTIKDFLRSAGVSNVDGLKVEFTFLNPDGSPDTSRTDPYQGKKGDAFRLRVSLPYDNFRWTNERLLFQPAFIRGIDTLTADVVWYSLMDEPFTVDTTIPGWNP